MREKPACRRDILVGVANLAWILPLGVGIGQLIRFLGFEPPARAATQINVGAPESLPDLPAYIEEGRVWLFRDVEGYYAVDATCTHLGCTVRLEAGQGFDCGCHGSRFALNGAVVAGPASQPLHFVQMYWNEDGQLIIDRSKLVDGTFRLPVV